MTQEFTDETKLELLTGASNPDSTFNEDMEELNKGFAYKGDLDETGTDGEWFRFDSSGNLVKAQANNATNALVAGVLTLSGVQFDVRRVRYIGKIERTSWGLTPNSLYYLDPTMPGAMTTSKPSGPNIVVELGKSDDTGDKFRIRIKVYLETTPGSQPVYKTVTGDTGSTTADATDDTLNIVGGVGGIDTAVTPDTVTINGPDSLGALNTALSSSIDESTDPRDPNAHNTSHENGGGDEIGVGGLSGLLADDQNPTAHDLAGAEHNADTLADLNSKVSDATLDDSGDPRDPNVHAASHQDAGGDEIGVGGLSGLLADNQNPVAHASDHENAGGDEISVAGLSGELADDQPPKDHASNHTDGSDDVASFAGNGTVGLVPDPTAETGKFLKDDGTWDDAGGGGGQTDTVAGSSGITNVGDNVDADLAPTYGSAPSTVCEGDDARLSDARTPLAHALSSHTVPTADMDYDGFGHEDVGATQYQLKAEEISSGSITPGTNDTLIGVSGEGSVADSLTNINSGSLNDGHIIILTYAGETITIVHDGSVINTLTGQDVVIDATGVFYMFILRSTGWYEFGSSLQGALPFTPAYFNAYRTTLFDMASVNTWYDYPWNIAATLKQGFSHSNTVDPEQITITAAGVYRVSWGLTSYHATAHGIGTRLLIDTTEEPGSYGEVWCVAGQPGSLHRCMDLSVTADQVLEVQVGTDVGGTDIAYKSFGLVPNPTTHVAAQIAIERVE